MSGFVALLGKKLREQVRTYRMSVVAIVFRLFGILSPVLARYTKQLLDALGLQATGGRASRRSMATGSRASRGSSAARAAPKSSTPGDDRIGEGPTRPFGATSRPETMR